MLIVVKCSVCIYCFTKNIFIFADDALLKIWLSRSVSGYRCTLKTIKVLPLNKISVVSKRPLSQTIQPRYVGNFIIFVVIYVLARHKQKFNTPFFLSYHCEKKKDKIFLAIYRQLTGTYKKLDVGTRKLNCLNGNYILYKVTLN